MRKSICLQLLLLFVGNNLLSQEYQKMVERGNRWNYIDYPPQIIAGVSEDGVVPDDGPYRMTYSFWLSNDTTINGTKYVNLMCDAIRFEEMHTHYAGALREDTVSQQVFFLDPANKEHLVFSFNHTVGDTVWADSINNLSIVVIRHVSSIDTINLGEIQRKRFEIVEMYYDIYHHETTPYFVFTDYWIEGIGSLKQLPDNLIYPYLWTDAAFGAASPYELALLCFWHNGEQIYHNPAYDSCVYTSPYSDIKNIQSHERIILYPNPVSGLLHISCNEPLRKVELLDMDGNVLLTTSTNELNVPKLTERVYFIRATTGSGKILIERFIKCAQ